MLMWEVMTYAQHPYDDMDNQMVSSYVHKHVYGAPWDAYRAHSDMDDQVHTYMSMYCQGCIPSMDYLHSLKYRYWISWKLATGWNCHM